LDNDRSSCDLPEADVVRAAVLRAVGGPAAITDITLRDLGPPDIRVAIAASGVCGTDLSVRDGGMPSMLPCTLGHEGAGTVLEVGSAVRHVAAGDHVVLTWNVACRSCEFCRRGESYLCPTGLGYAWDAPYATADGEPVWQSLGAGTLAEQTVVPGAAAIPIAASLPLDLAALLGCGVTTGVGAAIRTAAIQTGETVLVIGCGGVGLAAMQGARLAGASRIIAADRVAGQLASATRCGATDTVDTSEHDLPTAVRDLTGGQGVDHALEVVGKSETIAAAYAATRRGGVVTIVGAGRFDDPVSFPALSLMADAKTIRGSVYGATDATRDLPLLAELAASGKLDLESLVTRRISLDDVESAFAAMAAGDGARSLVTFDAE
jgi:S-(hydroxymethyl)glutathione dehydrogenase/alcohol dehydrogenase